MYYPVCGIVQIKDPENVALIMAAVDFLSRYLIGPT